MNTSLKIEADFSSQSLMILSLGPVESGLLATFLLVILITGVLSRAAIINFIRKIAPHRPINSNLLLDQYVELPCFLMANFMLLMTLLTGKPIQSLFGSNGSRLFWISSMFHNTSMVVGGMGIALYRLICIQDLGLTLNIKKAEALMNRIMALEVIFQVLMNGFGIAGDLLYEASLMNTAKGHTALMENILNPPFDGFYRQIGILFISFVVFAGTTLMIIELTCYIVLSVHIYRNDEKIKDAISKQAASFRRKKNIISLSTQISGIIVEIGFGAIGAMLVTFEVTDTSIIPILMLIGSATLSTLHLMGSSEMRNYYFSF